MSCSPAWSASEQLLWQSESCSKTPSTFTFFSLFPIPKRFHLHFTSSHPIWPALFSLWLSLPPFCLTLSYLMSPTLFSSFQPIYFSCTFIFPKSVIFIYTCLPPRAPHELFPPSPLCLFTLSVFTAGPSVTFSQSFPPSVPHSFSPVYPPPPPLLSLSLSLARLLYALLSSGDSLEACSQGHTHTHAHRHTLVSQEYSMQATCCTYCAHIDTQRRCWDPRVCNTHTDTHTHSLLHQPSEEHFCLSSHASGAQTSSETAHSFTLRSD